MYPIAALLYTIGVSPNSAYTFSVPRAQISLIADAGVINVACHYKLADILTLAKQFGNKPLVNPLGFYASKFRYTVNVMREETAPVPFPPIVHISLVMFLSERTVEVAAELMPVPCAGEAAVAYFRAKATADEAVFNHYVARVGAWLRHTPLLLEIDGFKSEAKVSGWARIVVDKALEDFSTDRAAAQLVKRIDDGMEIVRRAGLLRE